jgi:FlaA1/EpsC-like NDP-sugar epimerase
LVLEAGGVGKNGALYLLDMGEPVRIKSMAEQMIRFYGYEPEIDIKIETIGLRAGERLNEHLWSDDENPVPTKQNKILKIEQKTGAQASPRGTLDLVGITKKLRPICQFDPEKEGEYRNSTLLRSILNDAIPALSFP